MRLKDRAIKEQKQKQQMVSASQGLDDDDTLTFLDTFEAPKYPADSASHPRVGGN
jgi:hypothetical protein